MNEIPKLEIKDWENVKMTATNALKEAILNQEMWRNNLRIAEMRISDLEIAMKQKNLTDFKKDDEKRLSDVQTSTANQTNQQ